MDFASDNTSGATPQVLQALLAANATAQPGYGADLWSQRAEHRLNDVFEREVSAFLVATGTAANALALAALSPPWGAIFAHEDAHVNEDECGAPEMASAGAKLVPVPGAHGKITPEALAATFPRYPRGAMKSVQPAAVSISQATEAGTIYTPEEIAALAEASHAQGCRLHMDGARFANALVALGCSAAEMSWKAGVDALSFGATKNGALACEAVIFFDAALAQDFLFRRKRAGHTVSKGRLLGAQLCAMLEDDHWLANARHANAMATRLEDGLRQVGARLPWPRQANEVFPILPRRVEAALKAAGARYYEWGARCLPAAAGPGEGEAMIRLVTAWSTTAEEVDRLLATVRAA